MPTVNVFNNIDGVLTNSSTFGSTEWGPVRDDASSNQSPSLGGSSTTAGAGIVQFTGTVTIIYRAVFVFNTGGISVAPSSATMNIYTKTNHDSPCRIIKYNGYSDASLTTADWDDIPGFSSGNSMAGNVTDYVDSSTAAASLGSNDNRTSITLNSTCLSDIASLSLFQLLVVNTTYDYLNVTPSGNVDERWGMYFSNNSGTSKDPYIEYVAGASGYSHDSIGVAAGSIGKIKAIATTSISKVIGV